MDELQHPVDKSSLWLKSTEAPHPSHSPYSQETDVIVVGAGITGLHAALELKKSGHSVTVVEAKTPGAGTSGHTSAHASAVQDAGYATIAAKHGDETAAHIGGVLRDALDEMESRGDACEWKRVPAYLFAASQADVSEIEAEREALLKAGFAASAFDSAPLPIGTLPGVRIENQAQFHPVKYLAALQRELEALGVPVLTGVVARSAEEKPSGITLTTSENSIFAQQIVMATHYPWSLIAESEAIPYRSYLVAMEIDAPLEPGLYWDTSEPYHYIRNVEIDGKTLALVGGSDHRTGYFGKEDWRAFAALEAFARNQIGAGETLYQWSAQFYEPFDDIPFIGKAAGKERLWISTGYSGNGLAFGVAAGKLIANAINGEEHPLLQATRPDRAPSATSASTLIAENARAGYRYARDRIFRDGEEAMHELAPGESDVFKVDGELVAAHRDEDGNLIRRSAVCTHKGGIVQWNPLEKSWDCPIHGGRFSCHGDWLEGPPTKDLPSQE